MNATFRQTIPNDLGALGRLMNDATAFLEKEQVDTQAVYRVNLALEELVSNIIKYGFDDRDRHQIEVTVDLTPGEVMVTMEDNGHEFNPLNAPRKDTTLPLDQREIGGLGLELIRKLFGPLTYRREPGRNVLSITTGRKTNE